MTATVIRCAWARVTGTGYLELPLGITREMIETALAHLNAEKIGEYGTPAFEVNNEYFRVGRQMIRLCTEDEIFVSLWGPKSVISAVYQLVMMG